MDTMGSILSILGRTFGLTYASPTPSEQNAKTPGSGIVSQVQCDEAMNKYRLSKRGAFNSSFRDVWGPREKFGINPWSPTNKEGLILLRLAENYLLHNDIADFIRTQINVLPTEHLTYSTGPRGSFRLRRALARYFEQEFKSNVLISTDDLFITLGLAAAIDSVVFAICDEGEGIMVPEPYYNGFKIDITHRSFAHIIGVSYDDLPGYTSYDDVFDPEMTRKALEASYHRSKAQGIEPRAVLISNPHNPLGRCYPAETIKVFISFCKDNNIHFISDEIYAKSVFENPEIPAECREFTSALSLNWGAMIDRNHFHVLYSASKDFCANGMRLGVVYTQNRGILGSMSSIGAFSWSPHMVQDLWAAMLENTEWRTRMHAKNIALMAENYNIITSFMRGHGLRYYQMNAGLYLWVDCRRFMFPESERKNADFKLLRVGQPGGEVYAKREARILEVCIDKGVMISPGTIYLAREYGWFRITFTAEREMLEEGLDRIWKALHDPEVSTWKSLPIN